MSSILGEKYIYWTSLFLNLFFFLVISKATPVAFGGFQPRGLIGAVAAGHSHSNAGSEQTLWPTPQLTAAPDP